MATSTGGGAGGVKMQCIPSSDRTSAVSDSSASTFVEPVKYLFNTGQSLGGVRSGQLVECSLCEIKSAETVSINHRQIPEPDLHKVTTLLSKFV